MRYNKVRGIVRAKQGSQIPKFWNGGYTPNLPQFLGPNFSWNFDKQMQLGLSQLLQGITYNPNPNMTGSTTPLPTTNSDITGNNLYIPKPNVTDIKISEITPVFTGKTALKDLLKLKFGNFMENGGNLLASAGLDLLGNSFNDVENSGGVNTAFLAGDTIANGLGAVNPVLGLYAKGAMTLLKGINSIGGKKTLAFSADLSTISQVGGSYGGSVADINNAASKANTKYGLFSGGARRKADRQINEARRQQNIMTDIANDARDMQAMSGNDLNYINYNFDINGGYDLRYMRAAKFGMKILDKIDFVKNEINIKSFINLDTKEIEWNPIIEEVEEWEPIIEFKEGGSLPELWEPEIELVEEWEPVITDYVEEFKEGGSIKEELETPEIEETNQKNLIPEGALHKNKHHMEHTEGLTLKGIPVIDNSGEQLAEIELDEIIFTLEVTKKLEELYKEGTDEAAIEAGKLLVKEILFNTDDRTGLISKCEKGGVLNEIS